MNKIYTCIWRILQTHIDTLCITTVVKSNHIEQKSTVTYTDITTFFTQCELLNLDDVKAKADKIDCHVCDNKLIVNSILSFNVFILYKEKHIAEYYCPLKSMFSLL